MPSNLLKPQALKEGSHVAILPLASAVKKNIFEIGQNYIRSKKIIPKTTINPVFSGYKSLFSTTSANKRSEEFEKAFLTKEIKAVLSLRGGYGSAEMLPLINFNLIKKNPKIFVGFSDTTALLINLYQKAGLVCIHGPSYIVHGFKATGGDKQAERSLHLLHELISGNIINPFEKIKLEPLKKVSKDVNAKLTGGNLSILVSLMGTIWEPDFNNHILFLEETGEAPYKIHRMLLQLKQAGKFKKIKGVVLGDFIDSRTDIDPKEPRFCDVFRDIFKNDQFPLLQGLPVGHGSLNYPVPLGVSAKLTKNRLEIIEQAVIL